MSDGSDGIILQLRDFPAMFFAHNQDVAEIVILMGLPGAGKTTFYQSFFAASHAHISKDLWPNARERDHRAAGAEVFGKEPLLPLVTLGGRRQHKSDGERTS